MYDRASTGVYHLPGSISADKACVVDGVTIKNGNGMAWKKADQIPGITKPVTIPEIEGAVYRTYRNDTGEHFYTANRNEAQTVVDNGRIYEGIAWKQDKTGTPVYRLFNPNSTYHMLTTSTTERDQLVKKGWKNEGVRLYASPAGIPVYRLLNPNSGDHLFTTSAAERQSLKNAGWTDEGIAFRVKSLG